MKALLPATILAAAAAAAAACGQQDLISNFHASPGPGTAFSASPAQKAAGWTMGNHTLRIDCVILTMDFSGGGTARVSLWEGHGEPQVRRGYFDSPPQVGSGNFSFTSSAFELWMARTYWIVVEPDPGSTGGFEWLGTEPTAVPTGAPATSAGYLLNGQPDPVFNRLHVAYTCYANCDGSTQAPVLNVADFTCFLQKFAAGDEYANCDPGAEPCPPDCFSVADFTCFLQQFAGGCP